MSYQPSTPFAVPMVLLVPSATTTTLGVPQKVYPSVDEGEQFFGSFKTYGGTERDVNGVYSIEATAIVECWFNPHITSDCRVYVQNGNEEGTFEILGEPENINRRNQFLRFKIRRIKGGV